MNELDDWLERDSIAVGAPTGQVAASMLVQHVAMVLGGSTLAEGLLGGSLPLASADQIRVAPGSGTRWEFSLDAPSERAGDDEDLLHRDRSPFRTEAVTSGRPPSGAIRSAFPVPPEGAPGQSGKGPASRR